MSAEALSVVKERLRDTLYMLTRDIEGGFPVDDDKVIDEILDDVGYASLRSDNVRLAQAEDDAASAADATLALLRCLLDWHERGDGEEPQNLERYRTDLDLARGWLAQAGVMS